MKNLKKFLSLLFGIALGLGIVISFALLFTDISLIDLAEIISELSISRMLLRMFITLLSLLGALVLQVILHEGGHLIFGLLTGYRFVSFRVFQYTLIRVDGSFCIKRFSIAGTGGQCLLSPPDVDKGVYVPYFWYNIGGGLLNLFTSLIVFVIWTLVEELPIGIDAFLLFFSVIGLFLALINMIPFKIGGILNDGANILQMRRNPSARIDFALQLRINADLQRGVRLKDMPDEYFVEKNKIDYSNIFQVFIQLICASRYIDQFHYEKAQQMFEEMMNHKEKIVALLVKEMRCELLFLELIGKRREEVIESLYDKELDKYVRTYSKAMSAKQRLLFALSLCRDKNRVASEAILNEVKRKQEEFLMKGEVLSDIAIMEDCLSRE